MDSALMSELCPKCRLTEEKKEKSKLAPAENKDSLKKRKLALAKVEQCKYFYHHSLYNKDGQPDSLAGQRICSLAVKAKCGHEVMKYNLCFDWFEGKDCPDWAMKEISERK